MPSAPPLFIFHISNFLVIILSINISLCNYGNKDMKNKNIKKGVRESMGNNEREAGNGDTCVKFQKGGAGDIDSQSKFVSEGVGINQLRALWHCVTLPVRQHHRNVKLQGNIKF
ncbi:hypothetical protein BDQ17DRAFT_1338626 [Cyathus striatus]|nr:hypothetical protein BDQ17DRAFT_1338626 [Cyathus striatus]